MQMLRAARIRTNGSLGDPARSPGGIVGDPSFS